YSASQALRVKSGVYPVDKVFLVGNKFGDESEAFIAYVDGIIRIGGGSQSRKEVALFRSKFTDGSINRRLKEFEVKWYGSRPQQGNENLCPRLPEEIKLGPGAFVTVYRSIPNFQITDEAFSELWNSHPEQFHTIKIHGKEVKTPRWQQAYGKNYQYSGSRNNALPISPALLPFLTWCQKYIDHRLNGLLLNWYDGAADHYIGAHRDSTIGLVADSPIVTISLGEERVFRMRPYGGSGFQDFTLRQGDVLVIPSETNRSWTHEVPKFKRYKGRRISVTLRAYDE
ncbi:MAG: alpha-ketoglutarate-dependent dioxygenase AlkB, partial [Bacteroidota bacterium]